MSVPTIAAVFGISIIAALVADRLGQIIGAALPFLACAMITVALIAIFPDIALYLTRIG